MGEKPPLPYCCKCHSDLSKTQLRGLTCSHAYCQECSFNTFNCLICVTGTPTSDNQFSDLQSLYKAYQSAPSYESYSKMFEVINVNEVQCLQGGNCKHRDWCKYTHPGAVWINDESWLCSRCNINVEKAKVCPMCGKAELVQADPPQKLVAQKGDPAFPLDIKIEKTSEGKQSSSWWGTICCCYSRDKKGESKPLLHQPKAS